jgi:hypothetical protein
MNELNEEVDLVFDDIRVFDIMFGSDDEWSDSEIVGWGGSVLGKRPNIDRDAQAGHDRIFKDYFAANATFPRAKFERRYRMPKSIFLRIMEAVEEHDNYFVQKEDCTKKIGLSCLQKCTAAIRMLAYGVSADSVEEYCRMSETSAMKSMKHFCRAVVALFGEEYLRTPNAEDLMRLTQQNAMRGFPGMVGSIDCMHWKWKNCPTAWKGIFTGKEDGATVVLEAIASYDLWIWHAFFGTPGSCNDINVIDRSPILRDIMGGKLKLPFVVNNKVKQQCYFLADGIYPSWNVFAQTINHPDSPKKSHYAKRQEAVRKDVERAFGVLQARFKIVALASNLWFQEDMDSTYNKSLHYYA